MKALIVSDSHGLTKELKQLQAEHKNQMDVLIHCGDSELPPKDPHLSPYHHVQGNMDFGHAASPNDILVEKQGFRIFVTHGHRYHVKTSYMNLAYKAQEYDANIVCFGHSHVAESFEKEGIIFVNPGSIRLPRGRIEKTFAICECLDRTNIRVRFFQLNGEEILDLSRQFQL